VENGLTPLYLVSVQQKDRIMKLTNLKLKTIDV